MSTGPARSQGAVATETVTPAARRALVGSTVGYAMDGFDLLILGFMLHAISVDIGLNPPQAASLVTATLVGAICGGVLFGVLADRLGRVRVLSWTILVFAVATGLCGLARGYWDLMAYRSIAGLGLGGEFGIGMALVGEAWPPAKRARASSFVAIGWQVGVLAAAVVTPVLLPVIGWRGMFAIGVLPAAVAFFIRRSLRDPELFVEKVVRAREKPQSLRLLVADAQTALISFGMIVLCGVQNFGYYGVMIWLPNYLSTRFAYGLTQTAVWTAVMILGMVIGIYAFGQIADRIGRRVAFLSYMLGAAIMVVVYSFLAGATALLIGGAVMGFFVNGMLGGYGALMSELYPTTARATAQNVLFNIGRGIGGFGPVVISAISISFGFHAAIASLAVLYLLDMLALWLLIPERRGIVLP